MTPSFPPLRGDGIRVRYGSPAHVPEEREDTGEDVVILDRRYHTQIPHGRTQSCSREVSDTVSAPADASNVT
jgi:hypothetical protein